MKSWERIVTIAGIMLSIGGAYFVLPYRMDAAEKERHELRTHFTDEIKDIRTDLQIEKVKSAEVKEIVIRIEERLKGVQSTVDAVDRRQRIQTSSSQQN